MELEELILAVKVVCSYSSLLLLTIIDKERAFDELFILYLIFGKKYTMREIHAQLCRTLGARDGETGTLSLERLYTDMEILINMDSINNITRHCADHYKYDNCIEDCEAIFVCQKQLRGRRIICDTSKKINSLCYLSHYLQKNN